MVSDGTGHTTAMPSAARTSMLRQVSQFATSNALLFVASFVVALVNARVLGPELLGVWATVHLVQNYLQLLHFGIWYQMYRDIPYLQGRGDHTDARRVRDVAFWSIVPVAAGVPLALVAIVVGGDMRDTLRITFLVLAALLPLDFLRTFCVVVLKASKRFDVVSRYSMLLACLSLAGAGAVWAFHFNGLLGSYMLTTVLTTAYVVWHTRLHLSLSWSFGEMLALLRPGILITAINLSATLFNTVDRILILRFFGELDLGYYSMGLRIVSALNAVILIGPVIYPHLSETLGRTDDRARLGSMVVKGVGVLSLIGAPAVGICVVGLPGLLHVILPEYLPGLASVQILVRGCFFIVVTDTVVYAFLTIGRRLPYILIQCMGAAVNLCLGFALATVMGRLEGIAIATAVSYAVFALVAVYSVLRVLRLGPRAASDFVLRFLVLTPVYIYAVALLAGRLGDPTTTLDWVLVTAGRETIMVLLSLPLLLAAGRKSGLLLRPSDYQRYLRGRS